MRRILLLAVPLLLAADLTAARAVPVPEAPACAIFPADNYWHADVSRLPVHPLSALWLASSGAAAVKLHPDLGWSGGTAAPYGIPYAAVGATYPRVPVTFTYPDESDPGPYPLGPDTPIEGGSDALGDRHALVVDRDACVLYETYDTHYDPAGSHAGSGAIWDLRSNALRPRDWTSSDAAGLPVLPGLLRLDEVRAGNVDHAIRFTLSKTDRSWVWPARHQAGLPSQGLLPPMGAWFRLSASYDTSHFGADTRVVLDAMKKHGMVLADNGSDWFFSGAASTAWPDALISELKQVPASAFEAVDTSPLIVNPDSGQARAYP
jgi:hypothetical protein